MKLFEPRPDVLAWMHEVFKEIPVTGLLSSRPVSYDSEARRTVIEFTAKPEFCNIVGTVQGGILTAMLDNVMSFAVLGCLEPGHAAPTLEIKTTYVAPALQGRIVGEGEVVMLGQSIVFLEGRLRDGAGALLTTATATARIRKLPPPR